MTVAADTFDVALTDDAFLGGALQILQPRQGYRAGLDAVLLAASAVVPGASDHIGSARVLDVGAGVGVVGLCVARRCPSADIVLVERQPLLADLARRNIERNALQAQVRVVEGDVALGGAVLHAGGALARELRPGSFDHVVANPPYYAETTGTPPPVAIKAHAHQMAAPELDGWFRFLATATAADGTMTLIHRADALAAVLHGLEGRFGNIRVFPLFPREGAPAHRILVQSRRGSRAPLRLLAGLVLHEADHTFRPEVDAILRAGAPLAIG